MEGPAVSKAEAKAQAARQAQFEQQQQLHHYAQSGDSDANTAAAADAMIETPVNRVLMQTSTTGLLDVRTVLGRGRAHKRGDLRSIRVGADTWPFVLEAQTDVASAGLSRMLARLKHDAELQAVRFVGSLKRYHQLDKEIAFHLEEEAALQQLLKQQEEEY